MVDRQDWEEKYKRAKADYINLERRVGSQQEEFLKFVNSVLITKLLPILDDLARAVASHKDEGLSLILKNFWEVLKLEGVEEIKAAVGDKFDPKIMEGVVSEGSGEDATVSEVLRKGYKLRDKVIRPVQVRVQRSKIK